MLTQVYVATRPQRVKLESILKKTEDQTLSIEVVLTPNTSDKLQIQT